jgi:hypothetical protein
MRWWTRRLLVVLGQAKREGRIYQTMTGMTETVVALAGLSPQMNAMSSSTLRIRILAALLAMVPLTLTSGCLVVAAGAAGAGAVAWVRGELDASLSHPLDAVDQAANRAGEQLKFAKISESADALSRIITLRTAEDKRIEIRLTRTTDTVTRVRIRVGTFGDEAVSRLLLDKIQANL